MLSGEFAQVGYIEWEPPSRRRPRPRADCASINSAACIWPTGASALSPRASSRKSSIARARMSRPMLIILDEPCAGMDPGPRAVPGLDPGSRRQPADLSLVFVTHHIEEIMPAFGTLVLKDGRSVHQGDTGEMIQPSVLQGIYGVPMQINDARAATGPCASENCQLHC